jgi:prophage regulatory protein
MNSPRILRLPAVLEATGKSRSSIYCDIAEGLFPAPVKLGRRAVGWRIDDLNAWLCSRVSARASGWSRAKQ